MAIALLHHGPHRRLHAQKGSFEIGVHHGVKIRLLHHGQQAIPGDAGVVHQDVDAAEFPQGYVHQRLYLAGVSDAAPQRHGPASRRLAGLHRLLRRRHISGAAQHHAGSSLRQLQTHGPSDAPAAAGDHGRLSCKIHHALPSVSCLRVSARASTSAAVSTEHTGNPGAVFFTNPVRTFPGPISTRASRPMAAIFRMESSI